MYYTETSEGSVYVTLKLPDLQNFEIPLPPLEVQHAVAQKHDELQSLIEQTNQLIAKLQVDIDCMINDVFGD